MGGQIPSNRVMAAQLTMAYLIKGSQIITYLKFSQKLGDSEKYH